MKGKFSGKAWQTLLQAIGATRQRRSRARGVAVLIDGDGIPPRAGDAIFSYASSLGRVTHAQIFANFAGGATKGWAGHIRKYGIIAQQQFNLVAGKNGADVALAVAAVELAHTKQLDAFLIATCDADLAPVAYHLRRHGGVVHGVGTSRAAPAFRQACDEFISLDDLHNAVSARSGASALPTQLWSLDPTRAEPFILSALVTLGGARAWVAVPRLGEELSRLHGKFDARVFGRRNPSSLLDDMDSVLLDRARAQCRLHLAVSERNGCVSPLGNGLVSNDEVLGES